MMEQRRRWDLEGVSLERREPDYGGERDRILSLYSSDLAVTGSGFLATVIMAIIFLLPVMGFFIAVGRKIVDFWMLYLISSLFILSGFLLGKIQQFGEKGRRIFSAGLYPITLVYFYFFFFLILASTLGIFLPLFRKGLITSHLLSAGAGSYPLGLLSLGLVFGSAAIAGPLCQFWSFWYYLWLRILSQVDYEAIAEENFFWQELETRWAEARRYEFSLSLVVLEIGELKGERPTEKIKERLLTQLIGLVKKNVRRVDIVGRAERSRIALCLCHTNIAGAQLLSKRLKSLIEEHSFTIGKNTFKVGLKIGTSTLRNETPHTKALVEEAVTTYKGRYR